MFIDGFGISNYRSFGELQKVGPFSKVNIFIGENNAGKSNILRFVSKKYASTFSHCANSGNSNDLFGEEKHRSLREKNKTDFMFCIFPNNQELQKIKSKLDTTSQEFFNQILFGEKMNKPFWIRYSQPQGGKVHIDTELLGTLSKLRTYKAMTTENLWLKVFQNYAIGHSGGSLQSKIDIVLRRLLGNIRFDGQVYTIPSARELDRSVKEKPGEKIDPKSFDGTNIAKSLLDMSNPSGDRKDNDLPKFKLIVQFIADVLEESNIHVYVSASDYDILVSTDGEDGIHRSIRDLGTGIHEVVMIATAAVTYENVVMCIEEPEVHLHPILQKKLVRYLSENTKNQYFIATHSASLIDTPEASVFNVKLDNGQSLVKQIISPTEKFTMLTDLGYKSSDLVQSNCVVWVEGPSDRIFIKHWLSQVNPNLSEGIEYSFMMYGGGLLTHVTAQEEIAENLINIRRINQNLVVVMDSDRAKKGSKMKPWKYKMIKEIQEFGGLSWLTDGREIENYIDPNLYVETCKKINSNYDKPAAENFMCKYADVTQYKPKTIRKNSIINMRDKVEIARKLVGENKLSLDVLDLRKRIVELNEFIVHCNKH